MKCASRKDFELVRNRKSCVIRVKSCYQCVPTRLQQSFHMIFITWTVARLKLLGNEDYGKSHCNDLSCTSTPRGNATIPLKVNVFSRAGK